MPLVAAVRKLSSTEIAGPDPDTTIVGPSSRKVSRVPRSRLAVAKSPSLSVIVAVSVTVPLARLTPSLVSGFVPVGSFTERSSVNVTTPLESTEIVNASAPPALPTWPSITLPTLTRTSFSPVCASTSPELALVTLSA